MKTSLPNPFLILILLIFISILPFSCSVGKEEQSHIIQGKTGMKLEEQLTPRIEKIMKDYKLPGMVIGVVKKDQVIYARAFGFKSIENKAPLDLNSSFHMASVSKTFVATALMQLVEKGKVHLDSSLVHYLPYFEMKSGSYKQITIRQMLGHISGMPDIKNYKWDENYRSRGALEYHTRSLISEDMIAPPGSFFSYSNMAFNCLGDVIAKVSGKSFASYMKRKVLKPIGMKNSSYLMPVRVPGDYALPHQRFSTVTGLDHYPYNRMHAPSSTLHASVLDMCRWAITNLQDGSFGGKRLISPTSHDLMWTPWVKEHASSSLGLGWFIEDHRDRKLVAHSGGDTGFSSQLALLPEEDLGVVVLSNIDPAPTRMVRNMVFDLLLGYDPPAWKIPAAYTVLEVLDREGLDQAVARWEMLQADSADHYAFSHNHFRALVNAIFHRKEKEALKIARLCARIFSPDILESVKSRCLGILMESPDNSTALLVYNLMEEEVRRSP